MNKALVIKQFNEHLKIEGSTGRQQLVDTVNDSD